MSRGRLKTTVTGLLLAHRDIRVSAGYRPAVAGYVGSGAAAFSRGLAGRHGFGVRYRRRLELVFRILRHALHQFDTHLHRSFVEYHTNTQAGAVVQAMSTRVRLALSLLFQQWRKPVPLSVPAIREFAHEVHSRVWLKDRTTTAAGSPQTTVVTAGVSVQPLVRQAVRQDRVTHHHTHRQGAERTIASLRKAPVKPASMEYRRQQGSVAANPKMPGGFAVQYDPSPELSHRYRPQLRGDAVEQREPINVQQLTEQVVRAIDHKIIAQRERMGRG